MNVPTPWKWVGWNYGGDAFWNEDDLGGMLVAGERQTPVLSVGWSAQVEVSSEQAAHLIETAPKLLAACEQIYAKEGWVWLGELVAEANGGTYCDHDWQPYARLDERCAKCFEIRARS